VIQQQIHGARWRIQDGFETILPDLLKHHGTVVKESPAKLVTKHELNGAVYYVKRYRNDVVPFRPLKYFFKRSHARREWDNAQTMESMGIPVVPHLAMGERWTATGLQESILITRAFRGISLQDYGGNQDPTVQAAVGRLVRQMHDRGIYQFDLHPNILVHPESRELKRVDVCHAEIGPSLPESRRLDNIAFLNVFVPLTDVFFDAYGWNAEQADRARQRSAERRRAYLHARSNRCFHNNAEFQPLRIGRLHCWVRRPLFNPTARNILSQPDQFLETLARSLKRGRTSTVGTAHGLVLKRYNLRHLVNLPKNLFRQSKARRAYRLAYHLELTGIPSAIPVAAAEYRLLRVLWRSYFLMQEIEGAVELPQWRGAPTQIARDVAELLGQMHNEGFSHRDLKETNIIVAPMGKPYLIDLEGLRYIDRVSPRIAADNLARLARAAGNLPWATKFCRFVFIRRYCQVRQFRPCALRRKS
jgi:tRNA A-37 threonylcarbamoyl transferase component Bud32